MENLTSSQIQAPIKTALSPDERAIWEHVETANGDAVISGFQLAGQASERLQLLGVLAVQNSGQTQAALKLMDQLPDQLGPVYRLWQRAEFQIAARRESSLMLSLEQTLRVEELAPLASSRDPVERLVLARAELALGLSHLQDSEYDAATTLFEASAANMRAIDCESGLAVALTETGKVHAWRGRLQTAQANLLEALSIWQMLNGGQADAVWHEIGASLLDSGRGELAAGILERAFERNRSERTRHAWIRALISAASWDDAEAVAGEALKSEQATNHDLMQANAARPDRYRENMLLRELGMIAAQRALADPQSSESEARTTALDYLNQAIEVFGGKTDPKIPAYTQWIGALDQHSRTPSDGDGATGEISFAQIRLVQLELLIQSFNAPAEAAIGFSKVAEVFSRRSEPVLEIEAREQSAQARLRAKETRQATRQLHLALRVAVERGLQEKAGMLRARMLELVKFGPRKAFAIDGYLPVRVIRSDGLHMIAAAVDVVDGRQTTIHRFELPGDVDKSDADEKLKALETISGLGRGHPGLPRVLFSEVRQSTTDQSAMFLVTEYIEGQLLTEYMTVDPGNVRAGVRVIRDLSEAIQLLHNIGITACRPSAGNVMIEMGDNPVFWDLSPFQAPGKADSKPDVVYLADILVNWITGGKGAPKKGMLDIFSGRFPYNSLLNAVSRDAVDPGLVQLLNDVLDQSGSSPMTPGHFAAQLQTFV